MAHLRWWRSWERIRLRYELQRAKHLEWVALCRYREYPTQKNQERLRRAIHHSDQAQTSFLVPSVPQHFRRRAGPARHLG